MRDDIFQEDLRGLFNKSPSQMATPGAKAGELAASYYGKKGAEEAQAFGEQQKAEMQNLSLAQKVGQSEAARSLKEREFSREMDIGESQANRATFLAGIGAAIKLGSAHMVQQEMKKYVAGLTGLGTKIDDLGTWLTNMTGNSLLSFGKRKQQQDEAYTGGEKTHEGDEYK